MTSSRTPGSRDQMSAHTEHCRPRAKSPSTPASKFCCSLAGLPIDERFGLRSSGPISVGYNGQQAPRDARSGDQFALPSNVTR
jgi:hypothetical protein